MGMFESLKRKSSSLRRFTTRSSAATSSRYSSAPTSATVSRTTTPYPQTREDKLNALLSESIATPPASPPLAPHEQGQNKAPNPLSRGSTRFSLLPPISRSSTSADANANKEKEKAAKEVVASDAHAPAGYRAFLDQAKKRDPSYRNRRLTVQAPFDDEGGYNFFMQRKRMR